MWTKIFQCNMWPLIFATILLLSSFATASPISLLDDITRVFDYADRRSSFNHVRIGRLDNVHIRDCQSTRELTFRVTKNRAGVFLARNPDFSGWVQFTFSDGFTELDMYGVFREGKWFFLEIRNNRYQIFENDPLYAIEDSEDRRLFRYIYNFQSRKRLLQFHASKEFVTKNARGRLDTTLELEKAINICIM